MSLTETPAEPPKPKKHKRANRRRKKPATSAAPKPAGIYAGMTVAKCPDACSEKGCVISGANVCAHPGKTGLQPSMQSSEAVARFKEAKRFLGEQKLDLTKGLG